MEIRDIKIIIEILRLMCPLLVDIADRTDNPIDNMVVQVVCDLVQAEGKLDV